MPTYEYKCKKCNERFEVVQLMTDKVLTECEQCKGSLVRLISRNGMISFKGEGFYVNDGKSKPSESSSK